MHCNNSKQSWIPVFASKRLPVELGFLSKIPANHAACSSSYVGYSVHESPFRSSGVQPLELGSFEEGTIWHEFLHAVGLEHTMAREDRDNYVKILWENVIQDKGAKAL